MALTHAEMIRLRKLGDQADHLSRTLDNKQNLSMEVLSQILKDSLRITRQVTNILTRTLDHL